MAIIQKRRGNRKYGLSSLHVYYNIFLRKSQYRKKNFQPFSKNINIARSINLQKKRKTNIIDILIIEKTKKASDIRRPKKQYNPEQLFEFYFFARQ